MEDELKVSLKSKMLTSFLNGVIKKVVKSKLGIDIDICINGISVEKKGDRYLASINALADVAENDVYKLVGIVE